MKKYIYLFVILTIGFSSCETGTDEEPEPNIIEYPQNGSYGNNLLFLGKDIYENTPGIGNGFSLTAKLGKTSSLKIKLTDLGDLDYGWGINSGSQNNFVVGEFIDESRTQTFTSIDSNLTCDVNISISSTEILIEYFENDSKNPTISRVVKFNNK